MTDFFVSTTQVSASVNKTGNKKTPIPQDPPPHFPLRRLIGSSWALTINNALFPLYPWLELRSPFNDQVRASPRASNSVLFRGEEHSRLIKPFMYRSTFFNAKKIKVPSPVYFLL